MIDPDEDDAEDEVEGDEDAGGGPLLPSLDLTLPRDWINRGEPDEAPLWLAPGDDDGVGALQVSRFADRHFVYIAGHDELSTFAAGTGEGLGIGELERRWDEPCAMGRCGCAQFTNGSRVWITVAADTAYMWTWVDDYDDATALTEAHAIVTTATETTTPSSPAWLALTRALEPVSVAMRKLREGTAPEQLYLALFVDGPERNVVSGDERPTLSGRFASSAPPPADGAAGAPRLRLRGRFDADHARLYEVELSVSPADEHEVRVRVTREPATEPSRAARLRAASLWALVGERIDAPDAPADFTAVVLGVDLVRNRVPAYFGDPGRGTWLLLKATTPDTLYLAYDPVTTTLDLFPTTPMTPNAAALALFRAL